MRLRSIRVRNLGPFRDFSADLTTLPEEAKLVAITGPNGAGKSTLLELWTGGALFRECRTRGSLASLATSRDASLEVNLDNGQPWTIRHTVDSVSGKGESVALDADGRPATDSAKVRDFDRWAERHLPRPELLYSSQVLAQGSGGFLDLKPGDRKATVLRLLGVERLEVMAKAARDRHSAALSACATLRARIVDADGRADTGATREALESAQADQVIAQEAAEQAQRALDVARQLAGDSALALTRYREQCEALEALRRRHEAVNLELGATTRKLANNRSLLAKADQIRAAIRERDETDFDAMTREALDWKGKAEAALMELAGLRREAQSLVGQRVDLEARWENANGNLAHEREIRAAVEQLPEQRAAVEQGRAAVERVEGELQKLYGERLAGADERIGNLRDALTEIVDDSDPGANPLAAGETARAALAEDDERVERAESRPRQIDAAETALSEAKEALRRAEEKLRQTEARAALAARLDDDRAARDDAAAKIAAIDARDAELGLQIEALVVEADGHKAKSRAATDRRAAVEAHLKTLVPLLELEKPLATAEARIEELTPIADRLTAEFADLTRQLDDTVPPTAPGSAPDVTAAEVKLRDRQAMLSRAAATVGAAEAALKASTEAEAQAAALRAELATAEAEAGDWSRLADDLGRNGLQAALVDAACAELTVATNDLLHSCIGSRWTVSLETQRASADGKKQIEGFDVRVLDSEAGRDTTAETLSGGERVLVSEAISLALTTLACQRAGVERPTLIRDETGAALDPLKARGYVAMLRRAAGQIGADRVLFVSHNREVQELADARIEVGL